MRRSTFALIAAACLASVPAAAQLAANPPLRGDSAAPTLLPVGTRIRVTQSTVRPRYLVGPLRLADSTTLTLDRRADDPVTLPYAAVENVEVSRGFRTQSERVVHGAGRGLVAGAAVTAVLFALAAAVDADGSCRSDCFFSGKLLALYVGLPLTGVTTAAGALLGAGGRGERWATVRTPIRTVPRDTSIAAEASHSAAPPAAVRATAAATSLHAADPEESR